MLEVFYLGDSIHSKLVLKLILLCKSVFLEMCKYFFLLTTPYTINQFNH